MALSQSGAAYRNRIHIKDQFLRDALDDLASQITGVAKITNASKTGVAAPPKPPHAIAVLASGGFATVTITHNNPPPGVHYIVEVSTTPNFQNPTRLDCGISKNPLPHYFHGLTLYFRTASMFPTSALSPWIYFGGQANPTPTTF